MLHENVRYNDHLLLRLRMNDVLCIKGKQSNTRENFCQGSSQVFGQGGCQKNISTFFSVLRKIIFWFAPSPLDWGENGLLVVLWVTQHTEEAVMNCEIYILQQFGLTEQYQQRFCTYIKVNIFYLKWLVSQKLNFLYGFPNQYKTFFGLKHVPLTVDSGV